MCAVVRSLKRRRWGGEELLACRNGRGSHDVAASDLNDYLREVSGRGDFTAMDFRTWHATVLAAVGLAVSGLPPRPRPPATARSSAWSARWPVTSQTRPPSPAPPLSTRASPTGETIAPVLGGLGAGSDFGQLATEGRAERAVLRLLAG